MYAEAHSKVPGSMGRTQQTQPALLLSLHQSKPLAAPGDCLMVSDKATGAHLPAVIIWERVSCLCLCVTAQEGVMWGGSMRWLINCFGGMKLEILKKSGHGSQQVSHLNTQGYAPPALKEVSLNTTARCGTRELSHSWIRASQIRSKRGAISALIQAEQPVTHRKYLPCYGFPCPLTFTKMTWEGRCETHFHITRDGFVSVIHSATAVCAWGDLSNLQRLLFISIQVPGWKFQPHLLMGFRITRGMNLPFGWQRIWKPRNSNLLLPTTLMATNSYINVVGPTLHIELAYSLSNRDNPSSF